MSEILQDFINYFQCTSVSKQSIQKKNILNYEKGLLNFDIRYSDLSQKQIQIELAQNKLINQTQMYNYSHTGPIKVSNLFPGPSPFNKQQFIKNLLHSNIQQQILTPQHTQQIITDLNKEITIQQFQNNVDKKPNNLSICYQFDILSGQALATDDAYIDPQNKSFSADLKIRKNNISYLRQSQELIDFQQIESKLLQITKDLDLKMQPLNVDSKRMYEESQEMIRILNLDTEVSQTEIQKIFKGNIVNSHEPTHLEQTKNMNSQDFTQYLKNLKIDERSELVPEKRVESSDFRCIRLEDIQKSGSQPTNTKKWAIEDDTDLSNFYDLLPKDFELDDFQKRAILRLENNQSVLVCAHTSAGKTVIAEYSIALALRHRRKVIYTSPIKALSNEKYRKFFKLFHGDVGIITGDVSLNPTASCLIMTTEILRNMLYKQNDIIRDIEWVIFDEVHYVNDVERGVVWEETIIMMPSYIHIIMLSATVPNYKDFANWVGKTIQKQIYIQKTFIRPIPLEHSIYTCGRFHLIKEFDSPFLAKEYAMFLKNINTQVKELKEEKNAELYEKKKKGVFKNKQRQQKFMQKTSTRFITHVTREDLQNPENSKQNKIIIDLIKYCEKGDLLPCVVFVFSKAKIMELAEACSHLSFVTKSQESQIVSFYDKSIRKLKKQDQQIPQLLTIRALLRKGLAVHHGDILPIAKEITEILFSEGLVKVLFATETMAMGVNMPTKTVIFHQIQKHDGTCKRNLNSSEYTQMSGRAGRRGIDEKGNVIICISNIRQLPSTEDMTVIVDSYGEQLQSKYKITYSVIFNKMNSSDMNVVDMMRQSFCENDKYMFHDSNLKKYKELKKEYENTHTIDCIFGPHPPIEEFINNYRNAKKMNFDIHIQSKKFIYNMQFPKLALVIGYNQKIELCIILNTVQKKHETQDIYFDILLSSSFKELKKPKIILEIESKNKDQQSYQNVKIKNIQFAYRTTEVNLYEILEIFNEIITVQDDGSRRALEDLADYLDALKSKTNIEDLKSLYSNKKKRFYSIFYKEDKELVQKKKILMQDLLSSKCFNCKLQDQHIGEFRQREYLRGDIEDMFKKIDQNELQETRALNLRLEVLIKFKYFDENRQPLIKAVLAREMGNEGIYLCETLVNNILMNLQCKELAAILSGFVCQFQNKKMKKVYHPMEVIKKEELWSDEMKKASQQIYDVCYGIVREEMKIGITLVDQDESEYIYDNILNFNLSKTVYYWVSQKNFADILEHSDAQEGMIVRTIIRLENLIRYMKNASKVVGNMSMFKKLEECQELIKRDIVFTDSLYLQED